ncbi:MAG TPA: hypothetical protein VKP30_22005, partial [Polyangiaceae bacterium]|nr:hypothetical protein [Polyangiaceae bacterium]
MGGGVKELSRPDDINRPAAKPRDSLTCVPEPHDRATRLRIALSASASPLSHRLPTERVSATETLPAVPPAVHGTPPLSCIGKLTETARGVV